MSVHAEHATKNRGGELPIQGRRVIGGGREPRTEVALIGTEPLVSFDVLEEGLGVGDHLEGPSYVVFRQHGYNSLLGILVAFGRLGVQVHQILIASVEAGLYLLVHVIRVASLLEKMVFDQAYDNVVAALVPSRAYKVI
ncbi:hypothetical protein PG990_007197 [Apiospora arundinis]